jgi:proteic killer suppression protein
MAIDAERLNLIFAPAIAGPHSRHNYAAILHPVSYQDTIPRDRHAGLDRFYRTGSKAGIQPKHDKKLRTQLTALDAATQPQDLAVIPGWRLHELKGGQAGRWSITVNGNWRLTFSFEGTDVVLLDYQDYH